MTMNNMPQVLNKLYQAPQTPLTPEQAAYWKLNTENGQKANAAINQMPFVLDPAMLFGQTREQNMQTMYQPKPGGDQPAQAQPTPQSPQDQMASILAANPELLPILLQQIQQQESARFNGPAV